MRPLVLELSAFGPYLETQRVDFARLGEHGLFLIHGRTGSGKSSVLDALCYALFGKSTGDERKGEDFISTLDRGADTKVSLEYEHRGVRYRVTRRPTQEVAKRRGKGTTIRPTEATLEDLDSGEVIAAKAGDVTAAISEMLRCDVGQFRQTVVLPQGDFRRVVTEHKARREILASIFRTHRFGELALRLSDAAKELTNKGKALEEERARLLEEHGAENVADLHGQTVAAAGEKEKAAARKREASEAKERAIAAEVAGDALAQDFEQLEKEQRAAEELALRSQEVEELRRRASRAEKAAFLRGQRDELENRRADRADLQAKVAKAEQDLASAKRAFDANRTALEALEEQRPQLDEAERTFNKLEALRSMVAGLKEKLESRDRLEDEKARAEAEVDAARKALLDAEEQKAQLASRREGLRQAAEGESAAADELRRRQADLEKWDDLAKRRAVSQDLADQIAAHGDQAASLAMLTESVVANAPGLLAQGLDVGQPCPVCGSVHHPAPSLHGDVEAMRRAFEEFGQAASALATLAEQREANQREIQKLLQERGWAESLPAREELASAEAAAKARSDEITEAKGQLGELERRSEGLESDLAGLSKRLDEARSQLSSFEADLKGVAGEIKGALGDLPPEHHDPGAFAAALEAAQEQRDGLRARFDDAKERLDRARREQDKAQTAHDSHAGHLATLEESLERLEEEFAAALKKAGFTSREDHDDAVMAEEERAELERAIAEYDETRKLNAAAIDNLSAKLAGKTPPDEAALKAAVTAAKEAEAAADDALAEATSVQERLKAAHQRFTELERQDAELAERRRAAQKLSGLANGTLTGRAKVTFETFVLRSIFSRVLVEANRHLRHMTGGRYSMLLVDDPSGRDTGLELDVRDNQGGGETRPVHTLSGGEGFLASLALALGLSEISQRESGGVELGALFIDEGFGSLDSHALDHVIEILRGLEHGHRMVGIISHVEDLKRRIPVQLLVHGGAEGSRVEMRLNA